MAKELLVSHGQQDLSDYQAFSESEVCRTLSEIGYGPSKKLVDSFYLSNTDSAVGIGVLMVTEEHCRGHFGLFRGVDQAESIAQTAILIATFAGKINKGHQPVFKRIDGFDFDQPVVEGGVLNLVTKIDDLESGLFQAVGQVLIGKTIVSSGVVIGGIVREELLDRIIERRRRIQANTPPIFPPVK